MKGAFLTRTQISNFLTMFDYGSCKNILLKNPIKRFSVSDTIKMCHSVVTPTGLEPVTSGLGISRSILMSYGAINYETIYASHYIKYQLLILTIRHVNHAYFIPSYVT